MTQSLLNQLNLQPKDFAKLRSKERSRVLNFLLRWEGHQEAFDCLEAIGPTKLVSLADIRARALSGLGRAEEAIAADRCRCRLRHASSTGD